MAWKIGDKGFEMVLSTYVPHIIDEHIEGALAPLLARDAELAGSLAGSGASGSQAGPETGPGVGFAGSEAAEVEARRRAAFATT